MTIGAYSECCSAGTYQTLALSLAAFAFGIGTRFGLHVHPESKGIYIVEYLFVVLSVSSSLSLMLCQFWLSKCIFSRPIALCFHRSWIRVVGEISTSSSLRPIPASYPAPDHYSVHLVWYYNVLNPGVSTDATIYCEYSYTVKGMRRSIVHICQRWASGSSWVQGLRPCHFMKNQRHSPSYDRSSLQGLLFNFYPFRSSAAFFSLSCIVSKNTNPKFISEIEASFGTKIGELSLELWF